MKFSIIVAADKQNGIGKNNELVWRLPNESKYFAKITTGENISGKNNVVIMGRRTWNSIPEKHRPLKDRINVVLSSQDLELPENVILATSLDHAFQKLLPIKHGDVFVIGGGKVYKEAINHPDCEKIYLTKIEKIFECDTFFPEIDQTKFKLESQSEPEHENGLEYRYLVYGRV